LRLAAEYAVAANVLGDVDTVRHKAEVLRGHCADVGRDPAESLDPTVTALVGADDRHVAELVARLRSRRQAAQYAASVNAGTVDDHVGRFRQLAEAGVAEPVVRLPDLANSEPIGRFASVSKAFRQVRLPDNSQPQEPQAT
jgi:hypothetical protein